jgi:elongation factor Tu
MSAFSRALWRTSRLALRNQPSVNPLQQALGVQGGSRYVNGVRNYAVAFTRDKPHVNIGMYAPIPIAYPSLTPPRNHRPRRSRKGWHPRLPPLPPH